MTENRRFEEPHEVHYYETDVSGKITLAMMINLLVRVSYDQADALGVGTDYMLANNQGWVITQYEINITRMPAEHEHVRMVTEATSNNRYFAFRQFWLYDEHDEELAQVQSICVVMDQTTRKMVSIPDSSIAPYASDVVNRIPRLKRPGRITDTDNVTSKDYQVRYFDLDSNHHVNNAHYFDWLMDALDAEFLNQHTLQHVAIRFENEVQYGHVVTSTVTEPVTTADGLVTTKHKISAGTDQYAEAELTWRVS
ncbi:acyl-[acyl-carrier-protein] thioesterase [Furfurilactobacillus siliginis]|uniref:Acyl-ACP thioesterase n=1 Tax=Furfurilactobacillus siliginis TaxID=348151 RepID=A0A0R2L485_9LACO|nr:acyl-ACP thioesterase domain-containing protein [Furfurilactobacillus siliginis]KRN96575.1 acyl-ACP thioesterase [Furfurilactobacillus siliginis]GEK29017.1 acyl-ACP thioesterase [Furfurilactobacillus siliginis]